MNLFELISYFTLCFDIKLEMCKTSEFMNDYNGVGCLIFIIVFLGQHFMCSED